MQSLERDHGGGKREAFYTYIHFDVSKGDTVQFWHDRWCGDRPLKEMFPLLFECSRDSDAYIDALYTRISGGRIVIGILDLARLLMIGK